MKFGYCIEKFDVHLTPENLIETTQNWEKGGLHRFWTTDQIMQNKDSRLPSIDRQVCIRSYRINKISYMLRIEVSIIL